MPTAALDETRPDLRHHASPCSQRGRHWPVFLMSIGSWPPLDQLTAVHAH